jgi:TM2 domain-containing membrane protein YozV
MNNSDFGSTLLCIGGIIFLGLIIALAVALVKKSNEEASQAEANTNKLLQQLPQDKQMLFVMQYNSVKKNPTIAVILALFLGGLGIHKFYLGQNGLGILYLLFCWTSIPAIIALIEAFVISGQVGKYNEKKAREIAGMLGGLGAPPTVAVLGQ